MAAFTALAATLEIDPTDVVCSFLYPNASAAATCATDASDIANLEDVLCFGYWSVGYWRSFDCESWGG